MMSGVEYRRHLFDRLVECHVPDHLHEGLIEYIASRRPMGKFLTSVVSNDLMEAATRADPVCHYHLVDVVLFLVRYAPAECWGNPTNVSIWLTSTSPAPMVIE
jgi:hypothetical protein